MGEIKQLTIEDAPALQEISIETYTDTFGPYNTPENMQAYLVEAYNSEKLQKELANPHSDFYFIFVDNQLAGYMKLNRERAQTEPMGPEKLEVERLYILPAFKGKKLGTQLLELAEEKAREFGKNALWLGVWEHNDAARAFYKTIGYRYYSQHSFFMGDDEQTDFILLKEL